MLAIIFFSTSCPPLFCEHKNFCILCKDCQSGLPWEDWYSQIIIVADFWRIFEIMFLYWRKICFRKLLWSSFNLKKCCQKKSKLGTLLDKCPIRSYPRPHFPAFGLNTERYGVSLRIQSECRKIRTSITPNTDTFYTVVNLYVLDRKSLKSKRFLCDIFPLN